MRTILVAAIGMWTLLLTAQDTLTSGSVSGRVLDADTLTPLAGVSVGSREIGYVVTDQQGRYLLRGLKPGRVSFSIPHNYTSDPWPDKVVTVFAGREISGVDFRYRLQAQISGRVLDEDGNPLSGVRVIALTREFSRDGEMRYEAGLASTTDDRGAYAITSGIFAGRSYWLLAYQLRRYTSPVSDAPADGSSRTRVLAATFYPQADSMATAVPIVPRSLENRVVDIRMLKKPAYCVEATLMAETTPAQMAFVVSEEDRYAAQFRGLPNRQEGGTSGIDGKIRLCDLPAGRYRLTAFPATWTMARAPAYFNTVPITIVDRDVRDIAVMALPVALRKPYVPGSETLRITIGHDGAVIRASVVDLNGQPSINSAVIVFPANVQSEVELATTMVEGLTGDDGIFETSALQPGRYVLLATDDPPPYVTVGAYGTLNIQRSPEALARLLRARSRGQTVEVGPRATIQVNLTSRTLE